MQKSKHTFVIPLYNGEKYVCLLKNLIQQSDELKICQFILIDDFYDRDKNQISKKTLILPPNVKIYSTEKNIGQHRATAYGLKLANTEIIITIDQDYIRHLPEIYHLANRLKPINKEIIYLQPQKIIKSKFRNFGSFITLSIINLFGGGKLKGIYSIRVLSKLDIPFFQVNPFFVLDLALLKGNFTPTYVQIPIKIFEKQTSYSFIKLFMLFVSISLFYSYFFEFTLLLLILALVFKLNWILLVLFVLNTILICFKNLQKND